MVPCAVLTKFVRFFYTSVVVLEESPCPRGSSRTNLQVLVLVLGPQSPWKGLRIVQAVRYVWSCDVHKFCYRHRAWGYSEECLTYGCQILHTGISVRDGISASCTTSSIEPSIVPDIMRHVNQANHANPFPTYFHFRFPSKSKQIHFTHLTLFCYTVIYPYWPIQHTSKHLFFTV